MKKFISIILISVTSLFSGNALAQAYDGDDDSQLILGYVRIKDVSGIELQSDKGVGDVVSFGARITYLFVENPQITDSQGNTYTFDIKGIDKFNLGAFVRLHFSETFKLSEKFDPFLGLDISLKGFAAHGGAKYSLNDNFCVFGQFTNGFGSLYNANDNGDYNANYFAKQSYITLGLSIRLD
ncbi:MAG: hypothetical protein H7174_03190 [Flavobacterium sp.]|nr:hypothetical protein [Flavobacterium sp.]